MTLDDIVNGEIMQYGSVAGNLRHTIKQVKEGEGPSDNGNYNPKLTQLILQYTNGGFEALSPEHLEILEQLTQEETNEFVGEHISEAYKNVKTRLIERVEPNYQKIVGELEGKILYATLEQTPVSAKIPEEYKDINDSRENVETFRTISQKGDIDAYIKSTKHKYMEEALEKIKSRKDGTGNEVLKNAMKNRVGIEQGRYFSTISKDPEKLVQALKQKDDKGIREYLDTEKIQGYLVANTEGLSGKDKPTAYEIAGLSYTQHLAELEIAKRNAQAKAGLKE